MSERFVTNRPNSHMERQRETFFWIPKIHAEAEAQKRNSLAKNPISFFFFFSRTQRCDGWFRTQKFLQPHQSYSSIPHYCLDLQNKSSKQYPPKSFLIFFFSTTQQLWHDSDSTHRNSNSIILPELILWYPIVWISNSSQANNPASASSSP